MDDAIAMQASLNDLRSAYRAGILSAQYEGKSVTYRSLADMQAVIAGLERALGLNNRPKRVVVRTDKGWT